MSDITTIMPDLAKNIVKEHMPGILRAFLHRSTATRSAPSSRRTSGDAFETWAAKSGHPVESPGANPGFCFLSFEIARL